MPTFRQEIREFLDEATGAVHDGEPLAVRIHHAIRQGFDVVGRCLAVLDPHNAAALAELVAEVELAATELLGRLLAERPVAARIARTAVPWVVGPTIEAMAELGAPGRDFVAAEVVPRLDRWIETLQDVRSDLAG